MSRFEVLHFRDSSDLVRCREANPIGPFLVSRPGNWLRSAGS
jgi:hypothetical protein